MIKVNVKEVTLIYFSVVLDFLPKETFLVFV